MATIVQLNNIHNASPANDVERDLISSNDRDIRSQRAVFLKWLRKTHGWIGLWGEAIGLLFGVTGILQNHRTVLKMPAAQVQETNGVRFSGRISHVNYIADCCLLP